jgi:putative acetyltransferase
MQDYAITPAHEEDLPALLRLYQAVAAVEGGLARRVDEITEAYVSHFVRASQRSGLELVARAHGTGALLGEIHTYALGPRVFAHVLGELTIAVLPAQQGRGIGKALFTALLEQIRHERPDILRVELIARESNQKAITFYQQLGFLIEGRLHGRIRDTGGGHEADIPMAWLRAASSA